MKHTLLAILLQIGFFSFSPCQSNLTGESEWGQHKFVEYLPGNLPIIISVPHGGSLNPEIIADRTFGVDVKDNGTQEVAREMMTEFNRRTGKIPFMIFSHLHRKKLDVNREEFEGAQENETALTAWKEYHGCIDSATASVRRMFGGGMLIDLHGQRHPEERIEIGYRFESEELALDDEDLNSAENIEKSSLKNLLKQSSFTLAELIRGKKSMGALFDGHNVRSTPSPSDPFPKSYKYFSGGYTIFRHAAEDTTTIFGMQLELNYELRSSENIHSTAVMLTDVIIEYMNMQFGKNYTIGLK